MSRNFELLQKLGKEQEVLNANTSAAATTPANAPTASALDQAAPSVNDQAVAPVMTSPVETTLVPALEPVASLAQQVFISPGAEAPRSVVFASTEPGAGCSSVCAQVALALAGRVAGSVCLVETNFSDPSMQSRFQLDPAQGLAQALVRTDPIRNFARPTAQPNLWLITAGSPNAEALLASDRMRLRLAELRAEFDFILMDSPAMSLNNDAIALGSFADGVVLVLKANSSKRSSAKQAVEEMQAGKARVLGAVLNQRKYPIPQKIYDLL